MDLFRGLLPLIDADAVARHNSSQLCLGMDLIQHAHLNPGPSLDTTTPSTVATPCSQMARALADGCISAGASNEHGHPSQYQYGGTEWGICAVPIYHQEDGRLPGTYFNGDLCESVRNKPPGVISLGIDYLTRSLAGESDSSLGASMARK